MTEVERRAAAERLADDTHRQCHARIEPARQDYPSVMSVARCGGQAAAGLRAVMFRLIGSL